MLKLVQMPDIEGPSVIYTVPESLSRAVVMLVTAKFISNYVAGNFAVRMVVLDTNGDIKGIYPAQDVGAGRTINNSLTWGGTGSPFSSVDGINSYTAVPMQGLELKGGDEIFLVGNVLNPGDGWTLINIWLDVAD